MYSISIRFYEELNDFLPASMRKRDTEHTFEGRRSVKDLIESMGVPHVEVDLILINGLSVDFSCIVNDGDRISVYPVFESIDVGDVQRLRPSPLRDTKFVLDVHLRKLARRMRLLGFDTDYGEARDDPELARISEQEKRILLSRDRQLMMRRNVTRGIIIRNTDPEKQVAEVLDRLHLRHLCRPFTRCIACNGLIRPLEYGSPEFLSKKHLIPEGVLQWCLEYYCCADCGKIYWKGSHYDKLRVIVNKILDKGNDNSE